MALGSESSQADLVSDLDQNTQLVLPPKGHCFHCGDPLPVEPFEAMVLGSVRPMCCLGCQLAAQSIEEAGLQQYYLDRLQISRTANLPVELTRLQAYDHADIKRQFVYAEGSFSVAELSVNQLRCSACTWLIESRVYELAGVERCSVNLTQQRMRVVWDEAVLPISQILHAINQIGYEAKPYRQDTHEAMLARENKQMLIRLGIAALGAMQAMMFAVALYFGEYRGILMIQRDFLRWVSLFVSIPVFFYSGVPFFASAWAAIKARQVNMDVPVSLALLVTFFASLYATLTGQGETYFDSVSMFIFFLLAGRYIEHNARLKASNMANDLVVIEPILIQKIGHEDRFFEQLAMDLQAPLLDQFKENRHGVGDRARQLAQSWYQDHKQKTNLHLNDLDLDHKNTAQNAIETITEKSLQVGDIILIEAGSEIVCDGIVLSESATVSQSLLTGESDLIVKYQGDLVIGGSQNDSQPFLMWVLALPENSQIGLIDRLMNRALSEKPQIAQDADRLARWFVARVLILAVCVFLGWYWVNPDEAIWATVAVLVATCPCALSLATPIALTVATNHLAKHNFLTTRGHTLQTLAQITHVAFDKTGTLTEGKPNLLQIKLGQTPKTLKKWQIAQDESAHFDEKKWQDRLLAIAACMEVGSRHPIAHALLTAAYQKHLPTAQSVQHYPAGGIEAVIEDQIYRLGHWHFALAVDPKDTNHPHNAFDLAQDLQNHHASAMVVLSIAQSDPAQAKDSTTWQTLAYFYFNDKLRQDVQQTIKSLKNQGIIPIMLTGDPNPQALKIAESLGMDHAHYGLSPTDKVTHIRQLQANDNKILMVGDGINDAPVLAAADVSAAIAGAADLAQISSDSIILNGDIQAVAHAKHTADKTQKIIRQNLKWAVVYNILILLPAIFGYVPPWLAAIGMSISSFAVVMNALRLR